MFIIAILVALSVFMHGQLPEGHRYKSAVRLTSNIVVALAIGYISFVSLAVWYLSLAGAVSSFFAFRWGPEIGWDKDVRKTQALKAAWLTWPILPFGLPYIALRPLAYWIGYTKFTGQKWPDMVARASSGVFLSIVCAAALYAASEGLLAERLEVAAATLLPFFRA